jgi:hypothetical protein
MPFVIAAEIAVSLFNQRQFGSLLAALKQFEHSHIYRHARMLDNRRRFTVFALL